SHAGAVSRTLARFVPLAVIGLAARTGTLSSLWQCRLAVAFGEMLSIGAVTEWLGVEERFYPELRLVDHEQAAFDARLLRAAALSQRRRQDRARRGAVRRLVVQRRDGIFVLASGVFGLALQPVVPCGGTGVQPQGTCDAFGRLQRSA